VGLIEPPADAEAFTVNVGGALVKVAAMVWLA
jgi:hypothetical protein